MLQYGGNEKIRQGSKQLLLQILAGLLFLLSANLKLFAEKANKSYHVNKVMVVPKKGEF